MFCTPPPPLPPLKQKRKQAKENKFHETFAHNKTGKI